MKEYILLNKSVNNYAFNHNKLSGSEYSSKLSPWLANGSISVRKIYFTIKNFQKFGICVKKSL